jgi:hypothetical protein
MVRVAINPLHEISHDPQFGIVGTYMDVEVFQIVLRATPPVLRVICNVVRVRDDGLFAVL